MVSKHEERDYLTFGEGERALEAECFRLIFLDLTDPLYLFEAFGGIGVLRTVLEDKGVRVLRHEAWDHSPRCIEELRRKWPDGHYHEVDSFASEVPHTSPGEVKLLPEMFLYSADFNTFSPLRYTRDRRYQNLVNQMFDRGPGYIHITDSAVYRLHLNAWYYSRLFGGEITDLNSYLTATSKWFYDTFRYSIVRAAWHRGASYYLLKPGDHAALISPQVRRGS